MKSFTCLILLFFIFSLPGFSQDRQPIESQKLSQQILILYQQGKFDEAIPLAEKVLEIERKSSNKTFEKIASATINLAVLRKERVKKYFTLSKFYSYDAANNMISPIKEAGTFQNAFEDFQAAEKLLREVIKLGKKEPKQESAQNATAMNELAWLLQNSYRMIALPQSKNEFEEIEKLYAQAMALREKLFGNDNDVTLITVLQLAEFYAERANFEKALSLYERYISAAEKNRGKDYKNLANPLQAYSRILLSTDRESEAGEIIKRVAQITGQNIEPPQTNFTLSFRTDDWKVGSLNSSTIFLSQESMKQVDAANSSLSSTSVRKVGNKSKITRINVKVAVDETGKVLTAEADTKDEKAKLNVEKDVLKWKFKPFVYNGEARKMKGFVIYFQKESKLYQTRN